MSAALRTDGSATDAASATGVLDLITGAWRTQAVHAAVRFALPDHVAAGRCTDAELAQVTGLPSDSVARLMRLLVGLGVFARDDAGGGAAGGVRNTPVGDRLRTGTPGSLRDMCLLYGEEFYTAWSDFGATLSTGVPGFERVFGRSLWAHLAEDPDASERFQRAMRSGNFVFADVPRVHDVTGYRSVVDVAGGNGELLEVVLRAAPEAHGTLVDLPHMVPIARAHLAETVGPERATAVAGDVFEGVPPAAELYLLSRVLGDWTDEPAVALLRTLREAMSDRSRLLVMERLVPEDGSGVLAALWDLHLNVMNGGRHRTPSAMRALLERAGLRLEQVRELPMETSLLVVARA